jgi:hypothetical protein
MVAKERKHNFDGCERKKTLILMAVKKNFNFDGCKRKNHLF